MPAPKLKRQMKMVPKAPEPELPPKRPRISKSQLDDEASARIELGLARILWERLGRMSRHRAFLPPLMLFKGKELSRTLGIPESKLPLIEQVLNEQHPGLGNPHHYMRISHLQGGLWRLDFITAPPDAMLNGMGQYQQQDPAYFIPEPHIGVQPAPNLSSLWGEDTSLSLAPDEDKEVDRPTGWEHIAKNEED